MSFILIKTKNAMFSIFQIDKMSLELWATPPDEPEYKDSPDKDINNEMIQAGFAIKDTGENDNIDAVKIMEEKVS